MKVLEKEQDSEQNKFRNVFVTADQTTR